MSPSRCAPILHAISRHLSNENFCKHCFDLFGTDVLIERTPVPIKFSKNAAMLILMRVTDALRTKGASPSRVL